MSCYKPKSTTAYRKVICITDGNVVKDRRMSDVPTVGASFVPKNSEIIAMLGALIQVNYQLAALNGVLDLRQAFVRDVLEQTSRRIPLLISLLPFNPNVASKLATRGIIA